MLQNLLFLLWLLVVVVLSQYLLLLLLLLLLNLLGFLTFAYWMLMPGYVLMRNNMRAHHLQSLYVPLLLLLLLLDLLDRDAPAHHLQPQLSIALDILDLSGFLGQLLLVSPLMLLHLLYALLLAEVILGVVLFDYFVAQGVVGAGQGW